VADVLLAEQLREHEPGVRRLFEVLGDPLGLDQDVVRVIGHRRHAGLSSIFFWLMARNGGGSKQSGSKSSQRKARAKNRAAKSPTRGTAPSGANIDELEKIEPSDEAKAAEPSSTDAMGQDKRREVIGHAYGPSTRSQLLVLGAVVGTFVLLGLGGKLLADHSDKTPKTNPDKAPWSKADAPQTPAAPLE
jgi:hypothetical protein